MGGFELPQIEMVVEAEVIKAADIKEEKEDK